MTFLMKIINFTKILTTKTIKSSKKNLKTFEVFEFDGHLDNKMIFKLTINFNKVISRTQSKIRYKTSYYLR